MRSTKHFEYQLLGCLQWVWKYEIQHKLQTWLMDRVFQVSFFAFSCNRSPCYCICRFLSSQVKEPQCWSGQNPKHRWREVTSNVKTFNKEDPWLWFLPYCATLMPGRSRRVKAEITSTYCEDNLVSIRHGDSDQWIAKCWTFPQHRLLSQIPDKRYLQYV